MYLVAGSTSLRAASLAMIAGAPISKKQFAPTEIKLLFDGMTSYKAGSKSSDACRESRGGKQKTQGERQGQWQRVDVELMMEMCYFL